jgi:hypothetical protein
MPYDRYSAMAGVKSKFTAPPLRDFHSGREIYSDEGITGLNHIPVNELAGYALAGAEFSGEENLPCAPEEVVTGTLIEGTWLDAQGVIQQNIIGAARDWVLQYIQSDDLTTETVIRKWQNGGARWSITDYAEYGTANQRVVGKPGSAPSSRIRYHFNALSPTGVLYPERKGYARIEEVAWLIREAQRGPGAKTAIGGYVRNRHMVEQDLMSDQPYFFTGSDQPLDRMTSTAVVDQLISEANRLEPRYYKAVYIVDTSNPVQRPSGADRGLVLGPMFRYVAYVRKQVDAILKLYGASWTTDPLPSDTVAETAPTSNPNIVNGVDSNGGRTQ